VSVSSSPALALLNRAPPTWDPRPLKHDLIKNDSGVWGDEPSGSGDVTVLRSTDITIDGEWNLEEPALRSLNKAEADHARLTAGDLLVVKSSGSELHLGKTALVNERVGARDPAFSNFMQRLRVGLTSEPRYVWYLLNSRIGREQLNWLGSTTTGLRNLNSQVLGSVINPGPPVAVQRAIANWLDVEAARIDGLMAKKRRMMDLLNERRMAVTVRSVCGGDDRAWPQVRLTLVARLGSGHTPSRSHPEWWADCTIPWITTGEVAQMRSDRVEFVSGTRESISELGLANSSAEKHPAGTVVLCRTASAGYSAIMGVEMATSQDFATWTCSPVLRPRFLLVCLRAMRQDLLGRLAMGSTHKTIYMPDIEALRIPLPAVAEQDLIVDAAWGRLSAIDRAADALQEQIELLRERRGTLVSKAITGDLAVPGGAAA